MQDNKTASKKELKISFVPTGDCWNSKADQNNLHWSLATTGQGSILHKGNFRASHPKGMKPSIQI